MLNLRWLATNSFEFMLQLQNTQSSSYGTGRQRVHVGSADFKLIIVSLPCWLACYAAVNNSARFGWRKKRPNHLDCSRGTGHSHGRAHSAGVKRAVDVRGRAEASRGCVCSNIIQDGILRSDAHNIYLRIIRWCLMPIAMWSACIAKRRLLGYVSMSHYSVLGGRACKCSHL